MVVFQPDVAMVLWQCLQVAQPESGNACHSDVMYFKFEKFTNLVLHWFIYYFSSLFLKKIFIFCAAVRSLERDVMDHKLQNFLKVSM